MEKGFFKVFLPESSANRMLIPIGYAKYKNGDLPRKVVLKDRFRNMWTIGVTKIEENFYFEDGWEKFIKDNVVELGDFIIFYHDKDEVFNFKLLGINGCEKKEVEGLKLTVSNEEYKEKEDEEEQETPGSKCSFVEEEDKDEEHEEQEEEETQGEEEENERASTSKKTLHSKAECKIATTRKVKDHYDKFGIDIFNRGRATQPTNPYFVTKIRPYKKDQLHVPVNVVKDYQIELPPRITIRDCAGREFVTKLRTWKDGRKWLIGGWHNLCKWNLVEVNDLCICEFVKGNEGLYLQVQVLHERASSPPDKENK